MVFCTRRYWFPPCLWVAGNASSRDDTTDRVGEYQENKGGSGILGSEFHVCKGGEASLGYRIRFPLASR